VVATKHGVIQIWDTLRGIFVNSTTWSSNSCVVRFIHSGHLLLIGDHMRADILELETMSKKQTIWLVDRTEMLSVPNMFQNLSRRIKGRVEDKQLLVDIIEVGSSIHF
jgi:hypothetical protein